MRDEPYTVHIRTAANHVGRCIDTVREWGDRGSVPRLDLPFSCRRDPMTQTRYYRRSEVNAVRAALRGALLQAS